MSFILVLERRGYDPEYFGPFDTEEDAMGWGLGTEPIPEGTLYRVTTMNTPGRRSKLISRDEALRGWRVLPNGDMAKGTEL